MLTHDKGNRENRARPLVIGERYYALYNNDRWIDCFVTGTWGCGRSYNIQEEANNATLRRNWSHLKPRSFDIPVIHKTYLQKKMVLSVLPSITENSVLKQLVVITKQLANCNEAHKVAQNSVLSQPPPLRSNRQLNTP